MQGKEDKRLSSFGEARRVDKGQQDKTRVREIRQEWPSKCRLLQPLADGASESGEERSLNTTIARVLEFYDSTVLP